ncbi:MAG TPA: alpha-ketoglutarate-dependent dioxygenase AlkB [Puia sp.]|uniref:alpha-ketoglutarate-dependent dioxygenase AlkB family protein n=1 Tax=Puia sp. TaxID=2045100 RepID=UPI002C44F0D5|nr:alpha-ketoglutarate-dependent dioxygenase AlkB [Puia sp.]HVU94527.1 alpha-ketoglutarate-dependent dioxygenase AlkB [Puia sp.]
MDNLFNTEPVVNLLPFDGQADYYGTVVAAADARVFMDHLMVNIEWRNDEAVIFGRHIITKRKVAWYGDNPYGYKYSGIVREALPWTADLLALKALTEDLTGVAYNSCLLNLYHDGGEGMAWHSDDEKELAPGGAIASLSFGAERRFLFRHKGTKETVELMLAPGSLLVMRGATQDRWLHSLPKMKRVTRPRVNLTFRTMNRVKGSL